MASYDLTWSVMMLGDKDAGQTSLTNHCTSSSGTKDQKLTIGVIFYTKTTNYKGRKVKLVIWDLAGEERFRFFLPLCCKGQNGALLLYDITKRSSLHNLLEWAQIIREHAGDIPILLVGTEAHLEEKRAVTKEQGFQTAREYNLSGFIEVSSKTGQNIEHLFETMTEMICRRHGL